MRTEHFPQLTVPCFFLSGTKDTFATPAELREAIATIPGPVAAEFLHGGDHGLRRRDGEVADLTLAYLKNLL